MPPKTNILIVEDDMTLLKMFEIALELESTEFTVTASSDGKLAFDLAHSTHPDLILLDVMLAGGVDGIELCRRLRADPALYGTGVVMLTAVSDPGVRQAALDAGAVDYWLKPIRPRDLPGKIRTLLRMDNAAECACMP